MKLLFCGKCGDIFNLSTEREKLCHCGNVKGKYINNSEAVTNGKGVNIAIGNGSFLRALIKLGQEMDDTKDRQWYIDNCRVDYCWLRPKEGPGNPHSFIEKEDD